MILFVSVWPKVVSIAGGFGIFIMDGSKVLKILLQCLLELMH
ncbi:hypothetical protein HpDR126_11220 [Helicobacter pylori]